MTGPTTRRSVASAVSTAPESAAAVGEAVGAVVEQLGGRTPTLAVAIIAGPHHLAAFESIVDAVRTLLGGPDVLVAASASGVIGRAEEVEDGGAITVWASTGTPATPVRLEALDARPDSLILGLPDSLVGDGSGEDGSRERVLLLFADPFSFPAQALIDQLPADTALVGGLASASAVPGGNRFALTSGLGDGVTPVTVHRDGAVGVVLPADAVDIVVSQGCRPIGDPWVVTRAMGQVIVELAGRSAAERVQELVSELDGRDRAAAARGLHLGIVARDRADDFQTGDFLIRAVLGIDRSIGGLVVGTTPEVGQVVQLQVRDPVSASAELHRLLDGIGHDPDAADPQGALVFSCTGRGVAMFDEAGAHDATAVAGTVPGGVGGMFCAGELGPAGGVNAVHAFTATVVIFRG